MSINFKTCTEEELWKYVASHLEENGLQCVLVGGSVVSIYSEGAYKSGDLDLIIQNLIQDKLPALMKELGFVRDGKNYSHPECVHLTVEFPSGPLAIGEENNIKPKIMKENGVTLRILTPTDSIKDRLASYIYDKVRSSFDLAVLVAKNQEFQIHKIKDWCEKENRPDVYEEFLAALKS